MANWGKKGGRLAERSGVAMVMMLMGSMVARARPRHQRTLQVGGDRLVGIGLRSHQSGDALGGETVLQSRSHTAGNQDLSRVQRMRFVRRTFMKGLLDRQFQQGFAHDLPLFDVVNPELAALARMFGDRAAILASDCNLHVKFSLVNVRETGWAHAPRLGQVNWYFANDCEARARVFDETYFLA